MALAVLAGAQGEATCRSTPVQLPSIGKKSSRRLTPSILSCSRIAG
jgi:hypothetical protein